MVSDKRAKFLDEGIGKPGLQWQIVPDEQLLKIMIAQGMKRHFAQGFVEMQAALVAVLYKDYYINDLH